jgi:DNA-binding IclR family transcriptional regulator
MRSRSRQGDNHHEGVHLWPLRELVNRTPQSCHLTVFHAGRVMVVAQVDSPEPWAFGLKVAGCHC